LHLIGFLAAEADIRQSLCSLQCNFFDRHHERLCHASQQVKTL